MQICTPDDYLAAQAFLTTITDSMVAIGKYLDPNIKNWHDGHVAATKQKRETLQPFEEAEEIIKGKRKEFRDQQAKAAAEEEQRQRAAAKAEQDRIAAEQAAELAAAGEVEAAEAVIEQAKNAPPPAIVVTPEIPRAKGTAIRKSWGFRIDNAALVQRMYCKPDESKIRAIVGKLGPQCGILGITVFETETESVQRTKIE